MPYIVLLDQAKAAFPQYDFINALTPSEQKAAFHVLDQVGQHLCLKIIAPHYDIDRLHREIAALQSLDHPNIAKLKEYTYSSKPGQLKYFIVEEFVEGEDLSTRLGAPWPRPEIARLFGELCQGLEAARKLRIVHRDLKPSNIRVKPDGTPVIIDFGVARHLDLPDITDTGQGAAIGTPLYFSPEQFMGTKRDIDHRTDLFAVGILLYQALVAQHPFVEPGVTLHDSICFSNGYQTNASFISIPNTWRLLINKLLAKDRGSRPHSAAQVAAILQRIGGD